MDNSSLIICRICLASDVKMYSLDEDGLASIYNEIIGDWLLNNELPRDICFICKYKLRKLNEFKTICLRTYYNMCDLYMTCGKLTEKGIQHLKDVNPLNALTVENNECVSAGEQIEIEIKVKDEIIDDEFGMSDVANAWTDLEIESKPAPRKKIKIKKKKKLLNHRKLFKKHQKSKLVKKNARLAKGSVVKSELVKQEVTDDDLVAAKSQAAKAKRKSRVKEKEELPTDGYICTECGHVCMTLISYGAHKRWKHPQLSSGYKYKCDKCPLTFKYEVKLRHHERTHTGERPYVCDVCAKGFAVSHSLRFHMRTHTGERPFSCDKCDKAFAVSSALSRHKLTHSGVKPYKCTECDKTFTQTNAMKRHVRTIHTRDTRTTTSTSNDDSCGVSL